jgi:phosphate transport system substrate-binding protein
MRRATVTVAGMAGLAASLSALAGPAAARDQIQIVGSSTVFPYTQAVAERFSANTGAPSPVVESTGTGGGMQIFCQGIGTGFADLTGASRAMKASEWELCNQNGVTDVTEILLGYDGLSMAVSQKGEALDLSKAQLFSALAAEVEVDGEVVANPYQRWSEIDPALPDIPILVYGPPPTSGTRDAWVELVMEEGCSEFAAIEALPEERMAAVCQRMRTDGPFVEAGENDNLIVQRLSSDPNAYGIFGYSFLYENQDQLKPVAIGGVAPDEATIESGEYGVSRPLFVYVKNDHRGVIPNLQELVEEYVSDDAMGPGGYLSERGLIPLPEDKLQAVQEAAVEAAAMESPSS